jgi:hypothetical protein
MSCFYVKSFLIGSRKLDAEQLIKEKNQAYSERNKLVAFLARLYPTHLKRHPEEDSGQEKEWMNIVCIHSPVGQLTWHIHDSEVGLFDFLEEKPKLFTDCKWDGHTTEEKYARLAKLPLGL